MKHLEPELIESNARQAPGAEAQAEHLLECESCRRAVARARGRQRLLSGLSPHILSDVAFRRVEARLDEAVAAGDVAQNSWRWLSFGIGGLLMLVLLVVGINKEGSKPGMVELPKPVAMKVAPPFSPLVVVKAGKGAQYRRAEASWHKVAIGDVLLSGDAVGVDELVLAPELNEMEWAIGAFGSLSLGGQATLTVGVGEVVFRVRSPIEVLAATRRIESSDALFSVTRVGAEVVVRVSEGEVSVVDSLSAERRVLRAPLAVRWSDGAALTAGREEPFEALVAPVIPAKPWSSLDARGVATGTKVSLDGVFLGTAPFVELVTAGRRRLGLTPPGGALHESWAELTAGKPYKATTVLPARSDEGPEPDSEALSRVMSELKRQRPKLKTCYEKWLKANPSAQGEVVLELVVGAQGRVKQARIESGSISPASAECLTTVARSLVLPPLGAEATLQLPLVLRQR